MNFKTLLMLAAVGAVSASEAAVTSANTLCRIKVDSSAASTIVSLPLESVGATTRQIKVTELVMTDNLTVGDSLLVPNGTSWYAWKIVESGGKKVWESTTSVDGYKSITAPAAGETPLYCGGAVWLNRQSVSAPFYLYGQLVAPSTATETSAVAGEASAPAYTMMGNPHPEALSLNEMTYKAGTAPGTGDKIVVPADNAFGYSEYQWQVDAQTSQPAWCVRQRYTESDGTRRIGYVAADVSIEPGKGFWYVSLGGSPTVVW